MRLLVLVGATLSLMSATEGSAAVLCKTPANAIVVRDECRAKELRIALDVLGAQGPAGPRGPKGAPGVSPIRLVDAESREVGPALNVEWYLYASKETLEGLPLIHVLVRDEAVGGAALLGVDYTGRPVGTVYYASADCSGPPMVISNGFMPVLHAVGDSVFVPGIPASITIAKSDESSNFYPGCVAVTPRGGCCKAETTTHPDLLQASVTTLAQLGITPPVRAIGP